MSRPNWDLADVETIASPVLPRFHKKVQKRTKPTSADSKGGWRASGTVIEAGETLSFVERGSVLVSRTTRSERTFTLASLKLRPLPQTTQSAGQGQSFLNRRMWNLEAYEEETTRRRDAGVGITFLRPIRRDKVIDYQHRAILGQTYILFSLLRAFSNNSRHDECVIRSVLDIFKSIYHCWIWGNVPQHEHRGKSICPPIPES